MELQEPEKGTGSVFLERIKGEKEVSGGKSLKEISVTREVEPC